MQPFLDCLPAFPMVFVMPCIHTAPTNLGPLNIGFPSRLLPRTWLLASASNTSHYTAHNKWGCAGLKPARGKEHLCLAVPQEKVDEKVAESPEIKFSEKASQQLSRAIFALRRYGWLGFWAQLSLSLTSAVVLIFSVSFTAEAGPQISLYLTMFSTVASLLATIKNFGLVRLSRRMLAYLEAPPGVTVKKITKEQVVNSLSQNMAIAILGLATAVIGLQASVGLLLAKTLTNTTANPFLSGGSGSWNPVLAFDVFLLQASTNTILSHFIGLFFALWMIVRIRDKSVWNILFG